MVKTNKGSIPLWDYLEIQAYQYGFDSYEELYNSGYRIDGYEKVTPELMKTPLYVNGIPYNRDEILVFDIETTGLDFDNDEILQFSAVDGYGNVLIDEYFKPERITEWSAAAAINGIYPEMVADKPHFSQAVNRVQELFDNAKLIVGYNSVYFDEEFCKAAGIKIPDDTPRFDVMHEFAPIYGEWSEKRQDFKLQKLTTCANFYGYDFEVHNSLSDAHATLHCFEQMASSPLFYLRGSEKCDEVMLFTTKEEAISQLMLDMESGADTRDIHRVVVRGEIDYDEFDMFLEKHTNIKTINCCMNNETAAKSVAKIYGEMYSVYMVEANCESWSAELNSVQTVQVQSASKSCELEL